MKETKPKKKKKKANKKAYYVSPKEFLGRLTEYYKTDDLAEGTLRDVLCAVLLACSVGFSF